MGKGDRRTRKGKIWAGSTGNARPKSGRKKKVAKGKSFKRTPPEPSKA